MIFLGLCTELKNICTHACTDRQIDFFKKEIRDLFISKYCVIYEAFLMKLKHSCSPCICISSSAAWRVLVPVKLYLSLKVHASLMLGLHVRQQSTQFIDLWKQHWERNRSLQTTGHFVSRKTGVVSPRLCDLSFNISSDLNKLAETQKSHTSTN